MNELVRIIGDVHQKQDAYVQIANKAKYSVQIGDLGFNYKTVENNLNSNHHFFFAGNHDNFEKLEKVPPPHYLGRYGMTRVGPLDFYFIGGEFSIDHKMRTHGINLFDNEELSYKEADLMLREYSAIKPDVVLSHGCPTQIASYIGNPDILVRWGLYPGWTSKTAHILQAALDLHNPKLWIFGHFHQDREINTNKGRFVCLNELSYIDINQTSYINNNRRLIDSIYLD